MNFQIENINFNAAYNNFTIHTTSNSGRGGRS